MKPLIVLLAVFLISLTVNKILRGNFDYTIAGRIALSTMLLFTAMAHFAFTKGMTIMLPDFIPYKTATVYLTGLMEIGFAIGLFIPSFSRLTGWLLIVFLLLVIPANIQASIKKIDYQQGTFDGNGLRYLWFRIPLQLFFIIWTYFSAIKN